MTISGYLGVDVGATKSHALIADTNGAVLGFASAGPGLRSGDDYSQPVRVLGEIVGTALAAAGLKRAHIAGAGFGMAGCDWPRHRQPHLDAIATLGLSCPVEVVSDALPGLFAGASAGWGVNLVAGTYSNCRGRDEHGHEGRVTGAWFMGENGGAGQLVWHTRHAIAAAWSQRTPPTRLTDAVMAHVGAADEDDLVEGLALRHYILEPDDAPLVFQVAADGDVIALDLIAWIGRELASLALGVARQLDLTDRSFELVLSGSFFDGGPSLLNPLREAVLAEAPQARFVRLTAPPVVGSVVLAMQQAGLPLGCIQQARARLISTDLARLTRAI